MRTADPRGHEVGPARAAGPSRMTRPEERFGALAPMPYLIVFAGLATAVTPWLWPGAAVASELGHSLVGGAMVLVGLWRCWRRVVVVGEEVVVYRPRFGESLRLARSEIACVLPAGHTGNAPADWDLAAQLGLRTRDGAFHWLDLRDLRRSDRVRVRALLDGSHFG